MLQLKAFSIFIIAGVLEIGGGYLIWMWLRKGYGPGYGLAGALILSGCAIVTTFQSSSFGQGQRYLWRIFYCDVPGLGILF